MKKSKLIIFSTIFFFLFIILLININTSLINNLDKNISEFAISNQNTFLSVVSTIAHLIFEPKWVIILIFLWGIVLWINNKKKFALQLVSTSAITGILIYTLKNLIERARPVPQIIQETGFSFPSGHTMISIILFSFLILFSYDYIKNKQTRLLISTISVIMILIVGLSRIYLNVHWLSDVIASWLLGLFLISISRISFKD